MGFLVTFGISINGRGDGIEAQGIEDSLVLTRCILCTGLVSTKVPRRTYSYKEMVLSTNNEPNSTVYLQYTKK